MILLYSHLIEIPIESNGRWRLWSRKVKSIPMLCFFNARALIKEGKKIVFYFFFSLKEQIMYSCQFDNAIPSFQSFQSATRNWEEVKKKKQKRNRDNNSFPSFSHERISNPNKSWFNCFFPFNRMRRERCDRLFRERRITKSTGRDSQSRKEKQERASPSFGNRNGFPP